MRFRGWGRSPSGPGCRAAHRAPASRARPCRASIPIAGGPSGPRPPADRSVRRRCRVAQFPQRTLRRTHPHQLVVDPTASLGGRALRPRRGPRLPPTSSTTSRSRGFHRVRGGPRVERAAEVGAKRPLPDRDRRRRVALAWPWSSARDPNPFNRAGERSLPAANAPPHGRANRRPVRCRTPSAVLGGNGARAADWPP